MAYGPVQCAALITLAAVGGGLANPVLEKTHKIKMTRAHREALRRDGLLENTAPEMLPSGRKGLVHRLTDEGWRWLDSQTGLDVPKAAGALGQAAYALLGALQPAAQRAGGFRALLDGTSAPPPPAQPVQPAPPANLREQIRRAYHTLAKQPQDWVMLSSLRPHLAPAAKSEVDTILQRMFLDREIILTFNDDQGSLSAADRQAAIRIGVDDMHMLSMG